jgi:hypothetical protein
MRIEATHVLLAIVIGIGATLMPAGTFRHASIAAAPSKPLECQTGWVAHYSIGVAFAVALVVATSGAWLARPTLPLALLVRIGTVVFPFFVMQPSIGLGVAASKTPRPIQARVKSLVTHTVFGVGLYLCALGVSRVL